MSFKHRAAITATTVALLGVSGTAQAAFQGRDASGAASGTCTATGTTKCTYFYDTTLNITILNNWNIGACTWSASASSGSAQALAASAGFAASGLTGWVLPTGDGPAAAGAQNQYRSIWTRVGSSDAGLSGQFDGVQTSYYYWSDTIFTPNPSWAWGFLANVGNPRGISQGTSLFAVAVLPGDVAVAYRSHSHTH
jgi:hypothetical protein